MVDDNGVFLGLIELGTSQENINSIGGSNLANRIVSESYKTASCPHVKEAVDIAAWSS